MGSISLPLLRTEIYLTGFDNYTHIRIFYWYLSLTLVNQLIVNCLITNFSRTIIEIHIDNKAIVYLDTIK